MAGASNQRVDTRHMTMPPLVSKRLRRDVVVHTYLCTRHRRRVARCHGRRHPIRATSRRPASVRRRNSVEQLPRHTGVCRDVRWGCRVPGVGMSGWGYVSDREGLAQMQKAEITHLSTQFMYYSQYLIHVPLLLDKIYLKYKKYAVSRLSRNVFLQIKKIGKMDH